MALAETGATRPYLGPPLGCGWCAYEVSGGAFIPAAPRATLTLQTKKGPREVCEKHAERGHWRGRHRRVGAVA